MARRIGTRRSSASRGGSGWRSLRNLSRTAPPSLTLVDHCGHVSKTTPRTAARPRENLMINRTTWIVSAAIGVLGFGAGSALAAGPFSIPGADSARVTNSSPVSVGHTPSPSAVHTAAVPAVRAVPAVPARHKVPAVRAVPARPAVPAHHAVPVRHAVPVQHAVPAPAPVPVHHAEPVHHSEPGHH